MSIEATPPIPPDDKDWTWVLDQRCPDCGFDASALDVTTTGNEVRECGDRFAELLRDERASVRPSSDRWSAVEYGCHVRDVFRLYETRLRLMLDEDDPLFANWDQDVTAVEDQYASQEAPLVAAQLRDAAATIARSFDALTPDQMGRPGRRSDGASFTVDSFTRYFLHDPVHHVWDIERGYAQLG